MYVGRFDFALEPKDVNAIVDAGKRIKEAVATAVDICHPEHEDLSFLYGIIFIGESLNKAHHSRNVCIFADGEVDRSPTGTGVSGRASIHHARGEIAMGESIVIESILGTTMSVMPVRPASVGQFQGIVPRVCGNAFITGKHEFVLDPRDPLQEGFLIR